MPASFNGLRTRGPRQHQNRSRRYFPTVLKSSEFLRKFSKSAQMAIDPTNRNSYAFGDFRVDSVERVLMRHGEQVPLTPKVFDLLLLLIENKGRVIEKEKLMKEVWPDTFVEEGNLTQNISVLRKILSHDGAKYIQTVPRRGYRFVGRIREVPDQSLLIEEHSLTRMVVEETHATDSPVTSTRPGWLRSSWRKIAMISAAALIGIAAVGI